MCSWCDRNSTLRILYCLSGMLMTCRCWVLLAFGTVNLARRCRAAWNRLATAYYPFATSWIQTKWSCCGIPLPGGCSLFSCSLCGLLVILASHWCFTETVFFLFWRCMVDTATHLMFQMLVGFSSSVDSTIAALQLTESCCVFFVSHISNESCQRIGHRLFTLNAC